MREHDAAVQFVRNAIGRQKMAIGQEIIANKEWPQAYAHWLGNLEVSLRQAGFDEELLGGSEDMTSILMALVGEAVRLP